MIGKGQRSTAVNQAIQRYGAVYLGATGGAGALLARHIRSARVLAWPELGPEAVQLLELVDFPLLVLVDSQGGNLLLDGPARYKTP